MAKPIVPWIGGKRRLAKHLLPQFPEHTCYVEPFCGAAALFMMKEPSKVEVINDLHGELINLYRVAKHHLEPLYNEFKWTLAGRQSYEWLKATPPDTLTDIQRASRFLYIQKLSFGGKVTEQTYGTSNTRKAPWDLSSLENYLADAHKRLYRVNIEHLDWAACIEKYDRPHTFFYIDPPYWKTDGYGIEFGWEQYERLAEMLVSIQGKMLISLGDHPDIVDLFKGFEMKSVDYKYSLKGAVRPDKARKELMIANYSLI